jgi:hypothetical protein
MKSFIFIALMFIMVTTSLNAQWSNKYFVDDFGDPTNESYKTMVVDGTFSNIIETKAFCIFKFVFSEKTIYISVLEYGKYLANFSGEEGIIAIKASNSQNRTIKCLFTNGRVVVLDEIEYNKMKVILTRPDNYKMTFDNPNEYSNSSYNCSFNIK